MAYWVSRIIPWAIAVPYGWFAFVRLMNIASMGGFDWPSAPLPVQILDVFYLVLDVAVVYGFVLWRPIGFIAFFVAAISHIAIYLWARPAGRDAAAIGGLDWLDFYLAFQVVTIVLVLGALRLGRGARPA